jgi:hypothetical protein
MGMCAHSSTSCGTWSVLAGVGKGGCIFHWIRIQDFNKKKEQSIT